MSQVEILSPAGSMESFRTAINAGADAIYLGGNMFGARAFANNFDEEQLKKALEIAHIHGRKVYLTVNTLLKNDELKKHLYDFLLPAYEAGLDAVIVQDFGVFKFIKEHFPDMDIHASTQMTTNGALSAKFLEEKGASRVVTSRELSLEEIRQIRRETKVEIESFVHGALCYCYSGQCLMSSMIGGRSGNRGRCAQSCRLNYTAFDEQNNLLGKKDKHILSPKDMCALEILPDVIEAGVYSLKIEGRMKSPEYTAGVVSIYRKYVDLYLEKGRKGYKVQQEDLMKLMDLFNRGNFSKGYYVAQNGPDMMSMDRPNHQGTKAIQVVSVQRGKMSVKALNQLNPQDIVDVSPEFTWTNGQARRVNEVFSINIPNNLRVQNGMIFYRVRNNQLINAIDTQFINSNVREKVNIEGKVVVGQPLSLKIRCRDQQYEVTGNVVEEAKNSPMDVKSIEKQLKKLGETEFEAEHIDIELQGNVFVPVSELNELRRELVRGITEELAGKRITKDFEANGLGDSISLQNDCPERIQSKSTESKGTALYVTVHSPEQFQLACNKEEVNRIYMDIYEDLSKEDYTRFIEQAHSGGKEIFHSFPYIFRKRAVDWYEKHAYLYEDLPWDGFLVRNLDELQFIREHHYKGKIVTDYNVYMMNEDAPMFLQCEQDSQNCQDNLGSACFMDVDSITAPLELNHKELAKQRKNKPMEMLCYGYFPVMLSAQCVMKNLKNCQMGKAGEGAILRLKDRMGKYLPVVNFCRWCYNIIYHYAPLDLLDLGEELGECGIKAYRIDLALLNREEAVTALERGTRCVKNEVVEKAGNEFTRGHFLRGVE